MLLSNAGGVAGVVLPTLVNGFVATGISIGVASRLVAAEIFSFALITLVAPSFLNRLDRRYLAFTAIVLAAAGQFLSLATKNIALIFVCRACAGLGAGLIFSLTVASLSATSKPTRALAMMLASNLIAATALMALISSLARTIPNAAILILGTFVVLHLPFTRALPAHVRAASHQVRAGSRIGNWWLVILGLIGMFFLAMSFGAVWPMVGQIGASRGIDRATIALGLSVAGFGGIAGAVVSASLSDRLGRRMALLLGVTGLAVSALLTLTPAFVAAIILFMFCYVFTIPYYVSVLAPIDRTGRLTVLMNAMTPFGTAAGQTFAGILANYSFAFIVYGGEVTLLCYLTIAMLTMHLMRRKEGKSINLNALSDLPEG